MSNVTEKNNMEIFLNELKCLTNNELESDFKSDSIKFIDKLFKSKNIPTVSSNYISLSEFLSLFIDYYNKVISETLKLKKAFNKKKEYPYEKIDMRDNVIYLGGYNACVEIENGYPILQSKSRLNYYLKLQNDIYRYAKTVNFHEKFKEVIATTFFITEITKLGISVREDLKNGIISIEMKFGDFAVVSLTKAKHEARKIMFHSANLEIDTYLQINQKDLLNNICIPKEKIQDILAVFQEYDATLSSLK